MRRRHSTSICVHDPPCCYTLRDQGTDTSSEFYLPRAYLKKKRALPLHNLSKYYKRKEVLPPLKHYHPCVTSHRCNRISYERPYPTTLHKTRRRIRHFDEASTDARSLSEVSVCTSTLSVDVSCEMAAVNKEIETLLTRYEKAFDESVPGEVAYRPKPQGKGRNLPKPQQRRESNLSPEQLRLLSMERPPLDKLGNIPLEYLKPRIPSHMKEKLVQAQKTLGMVNKNPEKKSSPRIAVQQTQNRTPREVRNGEVKRTASTEEILSDMWRDMIAQGMIPSTEEPGKAVKEICANMKFDENSEVKIDLDAMSKAAKSAVPIAKSTGTLTNSCSRTISSIATQTTIDDDTVYKKRPQIPYNGMGDADRSGVFFQGSTKNDMSNDFDKKGETQQNCGDCKSEVEQSSVNTDSPDKFPSQTNNNGEVYDDFDDAKLDSHSTIPSMQNTFGIYSLQTSQTFEQIKKSFDEWLSTTRTKKPTLGPNLTPPSNHDVNLGSSGKLDLNSEREKVLDEEPHHEIDSRPLTCNFKLETKQKDSEQKRDQQLLNAELIKNMAKQKNTLNGYKIPKFNEVTVNQLETSLTHINLIPKLELNLSKFTNLHSVKSNNGSNPDTPKADKLEEISAIGQAQSENSILEKYQKVNKSKNHEPCIPRSQISISQNIVSFQKQRHARSPPIRNPRNEELGQKQVMEPLLEYYDESHSKLRNSDEVINTSNGKSTADNETSKRPHSLGLNDIETPGSSVHTSNKMSTEGHIELQKVKTKDTSDIKENHNTFKGTQELDAGFKKENLEDFDPPLCVKIIKKLVDTMMKCEPGKISDEIAPGKGVMYHLKQLRSDHLKHIQTEVKHIEDLDRCLEDFGVSTQLLYSSTRSPLQEKE